MLWRQIDRVDKMASIDTKPEVCRDFLRHACTRGSRCRFRHESTSGVDRSTSGDQRCPRFQFDVDLQSTEDDHDDDVDDYTDHNAYSGEADSPQTSMYI